MWAPRRVERSIRDPLSRRRACPPVRRVRAIPVDIAVPRKLPVDRAAMPAKPARDLRLRKLHLHQAAQAATFLKRKLALSLSHGDPGHTGCRTWNWNLGFWQQSLENTKQSLLGWRIARSQRITQQVLFGLCVEGHKPCQGKTAPAVVGPVKKRQLLGSLGGIIGRVKIQRDSFH